MIPVGTVTFSLGNSKELLLNGLDKEKEIRTIRVLLVVTLVSTAAAFVLAMADYATLYNRLATKIRVSMDQDDNNEALTPIEWRTDAIDSMGRDPAQEFNRIGDSVPATGNPVLTVKLPVDINYTHEGLDTPNLYAISTDQVNAGAAKIAIDWGATAGNIVLTNGTAVTAVQDAKVQMDWEDAHMVFCGPHWARKSKGATAQYDLEEYPANELLLAHEAAPATFEASVSQLTVFRDDRAFPRNMPPTELAQAYGRVKVKIAADLTAIDVTNNAVGGGTGSVISPILYVNARAREAEYESNYFRRKRRVEFPSGVSFAYQFLQKKTLHIGRQAEMIRALMGANYVGGDPRELAVRGFGGGDNATLAEFKGRVVKFTGT